MNDASEGVFRVLEEAGAMLLDFDGVLADSEPMFRRSWNEALEPWGHVIDEADYWKYWSSLGEGLEGEICRRGLSSVDRGLAEERQRDFYQDLVRKDMVLLFPGAARLLKSLGSGKRWAGRPYCIASNTPSEMIRRILAAGGAPVPEVVGGESLEKKPSPAIFLRASSVTGVEPSRTVVLEDSWKGVEAARRGGFTCVLVVNDYNRDLGIECGLSLPGLAPVLEFLSDGAEN